MTPRFDSLYGALFDDQRWFPSPAHLLRRSALLDVFAGYPPGRLLDAGCGAGRLLVDWDRLGHSGWGIDIDAEARALAQACVAAFDADFQVAAEPPPDTRFDYLTAIEVLEHLPDPLTDLRLWLKHLKSGGVVVASVPAFHHLWGKSDEWAGHVQRFEPDEFARLMEAAGLRVLSTQLWGYPLASLTRHAGSIAARFKMHRRGRGMDRASATRASGHDRSIESMLRKILLTSGFAAVLRAGIDLQRRHAARNRGVGVIVVARKDDEQQKQESGA